MERTTRKNLQKRFVKEDKTLTTQLNFLQHTKAVVGLEQERAQSAYMKRYSALLKRKNGGLLPPGCNPTASKEMTKLQVSGTGFRKQNVHRMRFDSRSLPTATAKNSENDEDRLATNSRQLTINENMNISSTAMAQYQLSTAGVQRHKLSRRRRAGSRSAPILRNDNGGLPSIPDQPTPASRHSHENSSCDSTCRLPANNNPERTIKKAWSPDLRVTSSTPENNFKVQCVEVSKNSTEERVPCPKPPIRGILVNRLSSSFPLLYVGEFGELRNELIRTDRRHSDIPASSYLPDSAKEGCKKRVSFIESQVVGHEAQERSGDPINRASFTGRMRGLNIVTLFKGDRVPHFKRGVHKYFN